MTHFSAVTSAYAAAWARRRTFVPLYIALRLLVLALIAPGLAAIVNLAVSLSDQAALTDQDIAMFMLTPMGFAATLAVASLLLVAEVLVFAVMAASLRMAEGDLWRRAGGAVALVLARLPDLLSFALRFVLRVLVLVLPFALVAALIAWWTLTEYDINYYLTFHPPAFRVAVVLIGLVGLALVWVLIRRLSGWALALHLVIFDRVPPRTAFGESARLMAGRRGRLKIELILWLALRLVIAGIIGAVASLAFGLVPAGETGNLRMVLILSLVIVALWSLAGLILAATALGALAVLLDGFFEGGTAQMPDAGSGSMRARLIGLLAVAAAAVLAGLWISNEMLEHVQAPDQVEVIGHRGAAALRPENTMASVLKAIEDGADWVEIDVQETADGEIVVMHDSDFMKMAGVDLKIWDATMDDLSQIDIGSWYDPAYADERAPTLREVLEAARGRSKVIIELKYYGHDIDLENRVIAIVEALAMQDQIATMSLKYPAVQKMRDLRPDWRTGVLAATAVGNLAALDGDFVAVNTGMATPGLIRSVHEAGKDLYVWTVNDPLQMSRMASLGVDGLITDEPALAGQVLAYRAELGPGERLLLWLAEEFGVDLDTGTSGDERP